MTVLSVAQDVCKVIALDVPSTLMSNTDREYVQLAQVARDTAKMIARDFDWQALQATHTFTGDGTSEAFALPTDYGRMMKTASMWSSRWIWAFNHIANPDEWLEMQVVPYTFINGNWIIYGNEFHFLPVMESTETIKFFYVKKDIVLDGASVPKETFTADTDTFRLSETLLELGMIWKWRENKGLPAEANQADYLAELGAAMTDDAGSKSVVRGTTRQYGRGVRLAFPQTVGG